MWVSRKHHMRKTYYEKQWIILEFYFNYENWLEILLGVYKDDVPSRWQSFFQENMELLPIEVIVTFETWTIQKISFA